MKLVLLYNLESEHSNRKYVIELSQIEQSHFTAQNQSVTFHKKFESERALSPSYTPGTIRGAQSLNDY